MFNIWCRHGYTAATHSVTHVIKAAVCRYDVQQWRGQWTGWRVMTTPRYSLHSPLLNGTCRLVFKIKAPQSAISWPSVQHVTALLLCFSDTQRSGSVTAGGGGLRHSGDVSLLSSYWPVTVCVHLSHFVWMVQCRDSKFNKITYRRYHWTTQVLFNIFLSWLGFFLGLWITFTLTPGSDSSIYLFLHRTNISKLQKQLKPLL